MIAGGSVPARPMTNWWFRPPVYVDHPATFRQSFGAWTSDSTAALLGGEDPRLTPSGDVARRGTIPPYVPFAVLSPRYPMALPQ